MSFYLAHKIELRPTPEQESFLKQSIGVSRFVYNHVLAHFSQEGVKWSVKEARAFVKILREEYPFIKDVSANVADATLFNLDSAYKRFFKNLSKYPTFKKKGRKDSYVINDERKFNIADRLLRVEKLKSRIKTREKLRLEGTPKQCTISYKAGKWFASILVKVDSLPNRINHQERKPSVGVDVGIKNLAVLSDGTVFKALQPLKRKLKKLASLQKKMARQQKGSKRRDKIKARIQKLHYYVACYRKAILNEATTFLVSNYDRIGIEDLNVSGMIKNHKLARAILDVSFYEFKRQLEYKSILYGNELVVADRWFPSTKTCSSCGNKQDMDLDKRVFKCQNCKLEIDRDLNAAINLNQYCPDRFRQDIKTNMESE